MDKQEIFLNVDQLNCLAGKIEALYTAEDLEPTGMTVCTVFQIGDKFHVFYVYENSFSQERSGNIYCKFHLVDNGIEDFVEVW